MKITYVSHDGNGFAETLHVPPGTNIASLFFEKHPNGEKPTQFQIKVRRGAESIGGVDNPITPDFVLQEDDRVAFTPSKIEAASH